MPEGPEIRRSADRVARAIEGRRACEVWFAHDHLAAWGRRLSGRRVEAVATWGKAMLVSFAGGHTVYSHNQLYGRWEIARRGVEPQTSRQLRLAVRGPEHSALLYSASDIDVIPTGRIDRYPRIARLGPDPLHASSTPTMVAERLLSARFARRRLGSLFLDQAFLAGIGNYLRSEVLWLARAHPGDRPVDLDAGRLTALGTAAIRLPRRSYRTRGATNSPKTAAALKARGLPRSRWRHYVFGQAGRPCPECGCEIQRIEVTGRRLYLCPACQVRCDG
jgi:endonuclease-8